MSARHPLGGVFERPPPPPPPSRAFLIVLAAFGVACPFLALFLTLGG